MNAPLSFRERRALQLHRSVNEDAERDPFDADHDPSEVAQVIRIRDDLSFRAARPPKTDTATPVGEARRRLAEAKALIRHTRAGQGDAKARKELGALCCWHETPELYRRMVAHVAGLGADVVAKLDRDLSEREKELIRSAVRDMRGYFDSLVRL